MGGGYTFSQVPVVEIPRSTFNRSHGHKTTFDAGYLIPFFLDEVLPGDTFKVNANLFARLTTPLVPFLDNLHLDVFWFAVPNRLVWDNWQAFCGERVNPETDVTDYVVPQVTLDDSEFASGLPVGSLWDYFGLPTDVVFADGTGISALYSRAYNLIWNEWFRDQNLQDSAVVDRDDGPDDPSDYYLRRRGKRHDYFTSCLPWPQKGDAVTLPLGGTVPIRTSVADQVTGAQEALRFRHATAGAALTANGTPMVTAGQSMVNTDSAYGTPEAGGALYPANLYGDLSSATAQTINAIREAFQVQRLLERDARGGTRYIEIIKSHFGVTSPDARLQRPEFLGGGTVPVHINPVAQTAPMGASGTQTPQGNLAAYGVAAGGGIGFTKSFVEHSVVMGLLMVRADLSYQQGLNRMFTRSTRYDFYWPAFAHLGEQAVKNKEIYFQGAGDSAADEAVFGYQERFAEYRYYPSKITGKLRSTAADTLEAWHLAQEYGSLPLLNESFIAESPPVDRVLAVQNQPHFLLDSFIKMQCTRPMPMYSVPGLIDHF